MGKHKTKKKNLRKRVQKHAKKLKELTAQDLLMNPALLYSPQFKALPMEKQFQLTSQLKQLKTMSRGGLGAAVYNTSGSDNALYHKLNEFISKNDKSERENAQLRTEVEAEKARSKELYETNKQTRKELSEANKEFKKKEQLDKAKEALTRAQESRIKTEANIIAEQTKEIQTATHALQLSEQERTLAKQKKKLEILQTRGNTPKKPPTVRRVGAARIVTEQAREQKEAVLNEQKALAEQLTTLKNNGENEKAENVEREIKQVTSKEPPTPPVTPLAPPATQVTPPVRTYTAHQIITHFLDSDYSPEKKADDNEKKKLNNETSDTADADTEGAARYAGDDEAADDEDADDEADLLSPTEVEAIGVEVKNEQEIKTLQEQINDLEELEQKKKRNQEAFDLAEHRANNVSPESVKERISLEDMRAQAMEKLGKFAETVPNFDENYRKKLTRMIQKAKNISDVSNVMNKIERDKGYQADAVKQQEHIEEEKRKLIKTLENPSFSKIYGFTNEFWHAKILQAYTLNQLRDVQKMMEKAKHAQNVYKNSELTGENGKSKAIDDMVEVQRFLNVKTPKVKDSVYIDSEKLQGVSPKTQKMAPSKDYKFIDFRNFEHESTRDFIPNKVLLDGVDLFNFADRFKASGSKFNFLNRIALKLAWLTTKVTAKLTFNIVQLGGQLLIAATSNPTLAKAALAGIGATTIYGLWSKSHPVKEDEFLDLLSQVDQTKILTLTDDEIQKQINDRISKGNLSTDDVKKIQAVKTYAHAHAGARPTVKNLPTTWRGRMWQRTKNLVSGGNNLFD